MDLEKMICKVYCLKCKSSAIKDIHELPKLSSNNRAYLLFECDKCHKKVTRFISKLQSEQIEHKLEQQNKDIEKLANELAEEVLKEDIKQ